MLSRQEVNTMRHLADAQYWDRPAGGNTGRLFLAFGGPVCADRFSNCPLDRVLTYKNLIYLLNLQFSFCGVMQGFCWKPAPVHKTWLYTLSDFVQEYRFSVFSCSIIMLNLTLQFLDLFSRTSVRRSSRI